MQTVGRVYFPGSRTPRIISPDRLLLQDSGCWPGVRCEAWESVFRGQDEATVRQPYLAISTGSLLTNEVKWAGEKIQTTSFEPGSIGVYPANAPYSTKGRGVWRGIMLVFDPAFLRSLSRSMSRSARDPELVPSVGVNDAFLHGAGLALAQDIQEGYPSGELYGETLTLAITRHLLKRYSAAPAAAAQLERLPQKQDRLIDYIEAHLAERVTLGTLAQIGGCDESTVCRWFKESRGTSPHQYVLRRRVERAKSLLSSTRADLLTIASDCGFASHSHFTSAFHRLVGVSPTTYRGGTAGARPSGRARLS